MKANGDSHSSSYRTFLAAEGSGDQGGHDDHGDNDLDGGGDGRSHVESLFSVDQCKRDEVSNYELRRARGDNFY